MADRRRINGPSGATAPPIYDEEIANISRQREPNGIRAVCESNRAKT